MSVSYLRYELLRTLRNRRFVVFSLGFPVVLYLLIAGPNRGEHDLGGSGISAPTYFMVGLVCFGTMNAMLGSGARIAAERQTGWNRQLRVSPLRPSAYLQTKVLTGYLTAGLTIVALYVAGAVLGVRLSVGDWLEMTGLVLIGLIPFAVMGIALGHLVTADSAGPAIGGAGALFAFLGGTWFPITGGFLHDLGQDLPSWWIVQAGRVALGGPAWSTTGWVVIAAWTAGALVVARRAYRRDTGRG